MKKMLFFPAGISLLASTSGIKVPVVEIPRLEVAPPLTRDADLSAWAGALKIRDFTMMMPDDRGENRWETIVHQAWGPDGLYVAIEAFDPDPSKVRANPSKRDGYGDQDLIGIDIDPSGKGQSCLRLIVNPLGNQMDAIVQDAYGEDSSYDCLWQSVGVLTPQGYVVKFRVPYSSLRRSPGAWGLRYLRIIPRERRYGIAWPRQSMDIDCDICQMAKAKGAPVEKTSSPLLVIPFVSATRQESLDKGTLGSPENEKRMGLDVRYSTSAMTFEGTYRPDFSNVEADVDPLEINSREKTYFSEKRAFFLEGMDLLGIKGAQRQFSSRSILDPSYGVKASGQASWASWSVLHARDEEGGGALGSEGAHGLEGMATRDTAAAMRFKTNGLGSGITLMATDRELAGGAVDAGGQSLGCYVDHSFSPNFKVVGSYMQANSSLPQKDEMLEKKSGYASSMELSWKNRTWSASASRQETSPDLVLVSGFTSLTGFRQHSADLGWKKRWNEGRWAVASLSMYFNDRKFWDGAPMDRTHRLSAGLETAGRISTTLRLYLPAKAWAQGKSVTTQGVTFLTNWQRYDVFQAGMQGRAHRVIHFASGEAARERYLSLWVSGNIKAFSYSASASHKNLNRESDGQRLTRVRQVEGSLGYQMPFDFYLRMQGSVEWYDLSAGRRTNRYIKSIFGWQPNAFTQAYIGWSNRRRLDPAHELPFEQTTDRGFFAKFAYAIQF